MNHEAKDSDSTPEKRHRNVLQEDRPVPPPRDFTHKSHSSRGSLENDNSTSLGSGSSEFRGFQPPTAPQQPGTRESYFSQISDYSGHVDNVDDLGAPAGDVRLVSEAEINVSEPKTNADFSDLNSEASSVQLGHLPTIKQRTHRPNKLQPDYSYSTNIEGSVPARSPRRPQSEIITGDLSKQFSHESRSKNKHRKHQSLAISDDLDALMRSASNLQEEAAPDVFESKEIAVDLLKTEEKDDDDDDNEAPQVPLHTMAIPIRTKSLKSGKTSSSRYESSIELHSRTASKDEPLVYSKPRDFPSAVVPPRPSKDNIMKAREVSLQRQKSIQDDTTVDGDSSSVIHTPVYDRDLSLEPYESVLPETEGELAAPYSEEASILSKPEHKALLASPETNRVSVSSRYSDDKDPEVPMNQVPEPTNEDEYYDIGEPVLVHKPTRAKSVKDSTVKPKKKTKKPKAPKKKLSSDLKPFSYNTLINLLESMNGTIIGEEFSQLNLPIKEKQLIEKIVDSLSRLTLDMVLDASRYEIGIQRLEKALRVLEGFM